MSSDNTAPPSYEETRPFLADHAEEEEKQQQQSSPPAPAPIPIPEAEEFAPQYTVDPSARRRRRRIALFMSFFVMLTYIAGFFVMSQSFHQHHGMHMQHHALSGGQDFEDGMWAKTIIQKTIVQHVPGASRPGPDANVQPTSFDECAKLDGDGSTHLETLVHHGKAFFVGPSFSGAKELTFVRDGPVGVPPHPKHPHKPPHKKPGHGPPKLPIPSGWPKPPHYAPDDGEELSIKPHPPKDHPKPYNVTLHVSRNAKEESDLFICSYKVPLFGTGVGVFGFEGDTIRPLRPSTNASTIEELAVKVHLSSGFPATAVGFRAPIFPLRPVPAPPASMRITRITTVVTQRLSDLKNRIKGAMPCRGRKQVAGHV